MKVIELVNSDEVALVDDDDFERISQLKWRAETPYPGRTYAVSAQGAMHRLVLDTPEGKHTDHIDGDGLDNRKENLRVCDEAENQWNRGKDLESRSRYKGVTWVKDEQRWQVRISVRGERLYLGHFDTEEDAAHAYDEAAKKHHGAFARLNFQGITIRQTISKAYKQAVKSGWHEKERSPLEIYALVHSEVSEAVEEARLGKPAVYQIQDTVTILPNDPRWDESVKCEGELVELADVLIRIFDYCGYKHWDLEGTVKRKMAYNATRSHRHGGKLY